MMILIGLLAVLLESSFLPLPFLLWWGWWFRPRVPISRLVWFGVILGVLLDVAVVRMISVSALALWFFFLGLELLKQFSQETLTEKGYVVICCLLWSYFFGGVQGILPSLMVALLTLGLMSFQARSRFEIKLKT